MRLDDDSSWYFLWLRTVGSLGLMRQLDILEVCPWVLSVTEPAKFLAIAGDKSRFKYLGQNRRSEFFFVFHSH